MQRPQRNPTIPLLRFPQGVSVGAQHATPLRLRRTLSTKRSSVRTPIECVACVIPNQPNGMYGRNAMRPFFFFARP